MHFVAMLIFSIVVSAIFAGVSSEVKTDRERLLYGLKVFGSFMGTGLLISILFYFLPR